MTLWSTETFPHGVAQATRESLTMAVVKHLEGNQPYQHAGARVYVKWNPEINLWFVYDAEDESDRPLFSIKRLEIHTASCYPEFKTKFAPHGSPCFLGTIVIESIMEANDPELTRVMVHPFAPAKTFFDVADVLNFTYGEHLESFDYCRRLLLDGPKIIADRRGKNN